MTDAPTAPERPDEAPDADPETEPRPVPDQGDEPRPGGPPEHDDTHPPAQQRFPD